MSCIPIEKRGLRTPRERVWDVIRAIPSGQHFTKPEVDAQCLPTVATKTCFNYIAALERAGFVQRVKGQKGGNVGAAILFLRVKDSADAPRVTEQGKPAIKGLPTLAMWRAMKVLKTFDYTAIAQYATQDATVVAPAAAKTYVNALASAGYFQTVRASKPGTPATYRLAKNTGPHAPAITRRKAVFDRNVGQFADLETAQEVCDALPE